MKKIKLNIYGMHCTSCAFNIDGELEDSNGVKESNTSYVKQTTEIIFDPVTITEKTIRTIIKKLGYDSELVK